MPKNTLTLRQQEQDTLMEKQERLRVRITELTSLLLSGIDAPPAEWDALADEYRAALKSQQDCEEQLKDYKRWEQLNYRQRQQRKKKK